MKPRLLEALLLAYIHELSEKDQAVTAPSQALSPAIGTDEVSQKAVVLHADSR